MTARRFGAPGLLSLLALGLCRCADVPSSYTCASSSQCTVAGLQGVCEPTHACSFPDAACPSGRRYASFAAGRSGACVQAACDAPVVEIASGGSHTCVRLRNGRVLCWGSNSAHQLGNPMPDPSAPVTPVLKEDGSPLIGVTALTAGSSHTCALELGAGVWCWGANAQGQLASGMTGPSSPRPLFRPLADVTSLRTRNSHTCALERDGSLLCWGLGVDGELGDGGQANRATPVPVRIESGRVLAVGTGFTHTCAVVDVAGTVYCWGGNGNGQLGVGGPDGSLLPVSANASDVTELALGQAHTCALMTDHSVWCWGAGGNGRLGGGGTSDSATAVRALGPGWAQHVSAGSAHTCAVASDGMKVRCWGWNGEGQLGTGDNQDQPLPAEVRALPGPTVQVAAGSSHTCALGRDGTVWCWGHNDVGELGVPGQSNANAPIPVSLGCPAP
jgi:alpha-tubulin suppressor-like RCC1 family protein